MTIGPVSQTTSRTEGSPGDRPADAVSGRRIRPRPKLEFDMFSSSAAPAPAPSVPDLTARLDAVMSADAQRLGRRLGGLRRMSDKGKRARALADLDSQISRAEQRLANRIASVPAITFPPELPVSERVD